MKPPSRFAASISAAGGSNDTAAWVRNDTRLAPPASRARREIVIGLLPFFVFSAASEKTRLIRRWAGADRIAGGVAAILHRVECVAEPNFSRLPGQQDLREYRRQRRQPAMASAMRRDRRGDRFDQNGIERALAGTAGQHQDPRPETVDAALHRCHRFEH